jgi:hypothetical protein
MMMRIVSRSCLSTLARPKPGSLLADRGDRRSAAPEVHRRPSRHHIDGVMNVDLTDEAKLALVDLLRRTIEADHYPLSPRTQTLKAILAKLEPPPAGAGPIRIRPPNPRSTARRRA